MVRFMPDDVANLIVSLRVQDAARRWS